MPMKMVSAVAAAPPGPLVHAMRAKSCQQQRRPPNQSGMPRLAGRAGHRWRRRQTFIDRSTTNVSRRWFLEGQLVPLTAQILRSCGYAAWSTHSFACSAPDAIARSLCTGGSAPSAAPPVAKAWLCLRRVGMRSRCVLATAWAAPAREHRQAAPPTVVQTQSNGANPPAKGSWYVLSRGPAKCLGRVPLRAWRRTPAVHVAKRNGTGALVRRSVPRAIVCFGDLRRRCPRMRVLSARSTSGRRRWRPP
mmetsp:Transcript_104555/g.294628  ORF Transcript_104555/g.294628 Transcript_104555/m.294628 type:complete len:248 (-) Transcript_104555:982-1725(-)